MSAHSLIVSAHALIAFEDRLRFSAVVLIIPTPLSNVAYSPTVLSGDTPCLTAGDAQRVNPWMGNDTNLRRRKRRTAPTAARVEFLPQRFQCDARLYTALMKENMYFFVLFKSFFIFADV